MCYFSIRKVIDHNPCNFNKCLCDFKKSYDTTLSNGVPPRF